VVDPAGRVKGQIVASLLAGFASLAAACKGPPVDVTAIWMDERGDRIRIYDNGELGELSASPEPLMGESHPRVHLGPGGRFILVRLGSSTPRQGRVYDLQLKRNFAVALAELYPGGQERVEFGARGDVLSWVESVCVGADCAPPSLWVSPLAAGLGPGGSSDLQPLLGAGPVGDNSVVVGAADAPVLYLLGEGELAAYRYPTSSSQAYELGELGRTLALDLPIPARVADCPFSDWCGTRVSVEPGGGALVYASTSDDCASGIRRWVPGREVDCLELPEEVSGSRLLGAIGDRRLVFVDDKRVRVVDAAGGWSESLPILGKGDYFYRFVDRGRMVLFGSYDGPLIRAERDGLTLVSNASTQCQDPESPVVAEDGSWAAWRCGRAPDVQLGDDFASAMVRVTDTRLDRYPGVAAWPLAIDSDGDLLFMTTAGSGETIPDNQPVGDDTRGGLSESGGLDDESGGFDWGDANWGDESGEGAGDGPGDLFDPFSGGSIDRLTPSPLTLYALSSDGVIRRVHDLEPTPIPLKLMEVGVSRYLQAK
jgi:hypothetical protein